MGEYLQEAVLPVQYDNYVFDLYGTLVDIHTEEDFPKLWEKLALFFGCLLYTSPSPRDCS